MGERHRHHRQQEEQKKHHELPALGNAIFAATDKRLRALPFKQHWS